MSTPDPESARRPLGAVTITYSPGGHLERLVASLPGAAREGV